MLIVCLVTGYPVSEAVLSQWRPKAAAGIPSGDGSNSDNTNSSSLAHGNSAESDSDVNSINIPVSSSKAANRYSLCTQISNNSAEHNGSSDGSDVDMGSAIGIVHRAEVISVSSGMFPAIYFNAISLISLCF